MLRQKFQLWVEQSFLVSFITESLKCFVNVSQLKVRNKILLLNPKPEKLGRFLCVFSRPLQHPGLFRTPAEHFHLLCTSVEWKWWISFGLINPVLKVMLKKKTALKHNNYSIRRNTEMTETIKLLLLSLLLSHLQNIDHDLLWSHKFYKLDLSIEFPKTFLQCHQTRRSGKFFGTLTNYRKIQ